MKSLNKLRIIQYGRDELTRVILLQHGPPKVVKEHVGGEWALEVVSVSILEHFLVFLLLVLFVLIALTRRLAAISVFLSIRLALN